MKKLIALTTVCTLGLSAMGSVSAYDAPSMYVVQYESDSILIRSNAHSLSMEDYQKMEEFASASITSVDGEEIPLFIELTIEELPTNARTATSGTTYAVKAAASTQKVKSGTGDYNEGDVTATANMTMYWTDVPGTKNTIDRLTGSVTVSSGTFGNIKYCWSNYGDVAYDVLNSVGRKQVSSRSFDSIIGYTTTSLLGTVAARMYVDFSGNGKVDDLTIKVVPSVLD